MFLDDVAWFCVVLLLLLKRTYRVADGHIKCGHVFKDIVSPPSQSIDGKPKVNYDDFHEMHRRCSESNRDSWVYNHEPFMAQEAPFDQGGPPAGAGAAVAFAQPDGAMAAAGMADEREATLRFKQSLGLGNNPRDFTRLQDIFPDMPPTTSRKSNEGHDNPADASNSFASASGTASDAGGSHKTGSSSGRRSPRKK